jgi:poly(A) polymerase
LLLGREPDDFDVATSASPDQVLSLFEKSFAVGAQFGVILVVTESGARWQEGSQPAEIVTEVATFRNDGSYSDGRRPDQVRFSGSVQEDVLRRDFTINGMMLDPEVLERTGQVETATLDFVGGLDDLKAGIVRAIGDPHLRFAEDKLRMLRAVRFAARFEFDIETATKAAILNQAGSIRQVSNERIRDELTRMLTEGHARRAFEMLDETGLLVEVLPEVARMKGVQQPPEYHPEGDVWSHTLLLLDQLPPGCQPALAWGALLHDAGKPATFRRAPDRIRFDGHVEIGVRVAEEVCARMRFGNQDTAQIVSLVENHMRFGDVQKMKESTLRRFFRLPEFDEHLALHKMDCLASHGSLKLYDYAKQRYESLTPEQVKPRLLVTGRDLIEEGYSPGPQFKELLALAEDAQLEGTISTTREGLDLIRKAVRRS